MILVFSLDLELDLTIKVGFGMAKFQKPSIFKKTARSKKIADRRT